MKNNKKHLKYILPIILIISFFSVTFFRELLNKDKNIDIFSTPEYSYLPKAARDYIEEVYNNTGELLLTEKNKEENKPYLNPLYIEYLSHPEIKYDVIPSTMILDYESPSEPDNATYASYYNLRDVDGKNYVTPVRNQGGLGICWAFATAGVAETYVLKQNDTTYTSSSTLFTERQIDYATSTEGIKDYTSEYVSFVKRELGSGGNFYISSIALANGISLQDYKEFKPYKDSDFDEMELSDILSYDKSLYELNSTIIVQSYDHRQNAGYETERTNYINSIKKNILTYGAAYVSTFTKPACTLTIGSDYIIDINDNCGSVAGYGHALEIIGWDDNYTKSYCADKTSHSTNLSGCSKIETIKGTWILKNSWGEYDRAYPRLSYDSLSTEISFITDLSSTSTKNWDNNYVVGESSGASISNNTYYLSDTKIKGQEYLRKIKYIAANKNNTVRISIKTTTGTKTYTSTSELPGLVTFTFPDTILIDSSSTIRIYNDQYFDNVSIFTSNKDKTKTLEYKNNDIKINDQEIRLYAETKNIPSGSLITYKLYDSSNKDVTSNIIIKNNEVAENNVNTTIIVDDYLPGGTYRLEAISEGTVVNSTNIEYIVLGGAGTKTNPYVITNAHQLAQIEENPNAYYVLGNDIDLKEATSEDGEFCYPTKYNLGCLGWASINKFSGHLDGQGHTIKGLYQISHLTDGDAKVTRTLGIGGLFYELQDNVTIKNIVLEDFDITCHATCAFLATTYRETNDDIHTLNISNITIKNSNIKGISLSSSNIVSGLIGTIMGKNTNTVNIDNIYIDSNLTTTLYSSGLTHEVLANNLNISNIELNGNITGKFSDGSGSGGLIYTLDAKKVNIENVISTIDYTNIGGLVAYQMIYAYNEYINIKNAYFITDKDQPYFHRTDTEPTLINVKRYNPKSEMNTAINSSWSNLNSTNWNFKEVNEVKRLPILKNVDCIYSYLNLNEINLNKSKDETLNIYEYLNPKTSASTRIMYEIDDTSIAEINNFGLITPKKEGITTLHIVSLYDGYEKNIPITIVSDVTAYEIEYIPNGGTGTMNKNIVEYNTDFSLPPNDFTKENYTFKEWNTKADGTGTTYLNNATINLNLVSGNKLTLYALWEPITYTISFNANGGTGTMSNQSVKYDKETKLNSNNYTRTNYLFLGWSTNPSSTTPTYTNEATIKNLGNATNSNITLYAVWGLDAYQIEFNSNGGTGTMPNQNYTYETDGQISPNSFTKIGYEFKKWNTMPDGKGTTYLESASYLTIPKTSSKKITLYVEWEPITYTISYNANGGTGTMYNQIFTYDESKPLNSNIFTRENYTFIGWSTEPSSTTKMYSDKQYIKNITNIKNANITLYAIWQPNKTYENYTYPINESKKYVDLIRYNTSKSAYENTFVLGSGYSINVELNGKPYIYTGSITKIYYNGTLVNQYTNIVRGDINGDAAISALDYVKIRNHIMGNSIMSNDIEKLASDVNNDSKITALDYIAIKNIIMGR